jgi:hypothetical protein
MFDARGAIRTLHTDAMQVRMMYAVELTVGLRVHERTFMHDIVMNACSETTFVAHPSNKSSSTTSSSCVQFHITLIDASIKAASHGHAELFVWNSVNHFHCRDVLDD